MPLTSAMAASFVVYPPPSHILRQDIFLAGKGNGIRPQGSGRIGGLGLPGRASLAPGATCPKIQLPCLVTGSGRASPGLSLVTHKTNNPCGRKQRSLRCHPASRRLDPASIYHPASGTRLDPASTQAPSGWMCWVDRLDGWVAGCWIRLESSLQRQRAAPGWQERSELRGAGSSAPTKALASRTQRSLRGGEMAGTPLLRLIYRTDTTT